MKKVVLCIVLALSIASATAVPALAANHVTARARSRFSDGRTQRIVITGKTSRRGSVKLTVYRHKKVIRRITATRSGRAYRVSWNLRTRSGRPATSGRYTYKIRFRTHAGGRASKKGTVVVKSPSPTVADTGVPGAPSTRAPGDASRWIGFYMPGVPDSLASIDALESQIGTGAAVINFFISDWESFPADRVRNAHSNGSIPLITLEFTRTLNGPGVQSILDGERDEYLKDFAAGARATGGTIWLRPLHEMNGNWYPWCGAVGANTPAKTVAAWKHIHDVIVAEGATNVKFVWNVNANSVPNTPANAIEAFWPGDDYVDFTSIDGYNWGNKRWSTPSRVFGDAYRRVGALSGKPMFIAETACNPEGGNKAEWTADFFAQMSARFPRIEGVCWFNVDKEHDWRIDETPATLAAIQRIAQTGY
jgi:beta-mannanase